MKSPTSLLVYGVAVVVGTLHSPLLADGPADNVPAKVRQVPPLGIEVPAEDRQKLQAGLKALGEKIGQLQQQPTEQQKVLLADVTIYHRAVATVLQHNEFFSPKDIAAAHELLATGTQRADDLLAGRAPWTTATGLVVRGYVSRLDGTPQPYGLVVPESYEAKGNQRHRLDLWFHGRGEKLSEVSFINERSKQVGQYAPEGAFVLHPYGRYSNAFKFAGEVDVLEALEHAKHQYRIDNDRISVRGFSMGGAACWQFAVHYADRWFAANPGAGFSETPEFLKHFQKETLNPTWYERKLWQWYDCPGYAMNLHQCPTIAYSGELDIQKQAADIMEVAMEKVGLDLVHIIGPETKHSIHANAKQEIEQRMAELAKAGRERMPQTVRFRTFTLKYNQMNWVTINGMAEHWREAAVDATWGDDNVIRIDTQNVTDLALNLPDSEVKKRGGNPKVLFDGTETIVPTVFLYQGGVWHVPFHFNGRRWQGGSLPSDSARKQSGLQGPIDDAFMDSFLMVRGTGTARHEQVGKWAAAELEHAVVQWRQQFRGDARVKADTEVTDEDIARHNLILWGDPESNAVLARLADKLPIAWNKQAIAVAGQEFDAENHALIMIYPNPLNPKRYVVLNSGFTYREYAYLNNARQVPKLPDWAVVDLRTPPDCLWPGKVVAADFFDEQWNLKPPKSEP